MDIADWRKKIDDLDRRLVELLSDRARAAVEIGRLKRDTNLADLRAGAGAEWCSRMCRG